MKMLHDRNFNGFLYRTIYRIGAFTQDSYKDGKIIPLNRSILFQKVRRAEVTPPHNAKLWKRGVASPGRLIPKQRATPLAGRGLLGEASPYVKFFLRGTNLFSIRFFSITCISKTDYYGED